MADPIPPPVSKIGADFRLSRVFPAHFLTFIRHMFRRRPAVVHRNAAYIACRIRIAQYFILDHAVSPRKFIFLDLVFHMYRNYGQYDTSLFRLEVIAQLHIPKIKLTQQFPIHRLAHTLLHFCNTDPLSFSRGFYRAPYSS